MSYETKPGNGSLFKNARKSSPNHPDYTGSAVLSDGTEVWLSAWMKESNGKKFMSISFKEKEKKADGKMGTTSKTQAGGDDTW